MNVPNSLYPSLTGAWITSAVYVALSHSYSLLIIHTQLSHHFHLFVCKTFPDPKVSEISPWAVQYPAPSSVLEPATMYLIS